MRAYRVRHSRATAGDLCAELSVILKRPKGPFLLLRPNAKEKKIFGENKNIKF